MSFCHYPCANPAWLGLPIDVRDRDGKELHVGDRVRFDEKEWGEPHEFIIGFEAGEICFSSTADDLESYATLVEPYAAKA